MVIGSPKFYNYIQKCISRMIGSFTGEDIKKIFHEYNNPNNKLYTGVSNLLILCDFGLEKQNIDSTENQATFDLFNWVKSRIIFLRKNEITNHDLYEVMQYTEPKTDDNKEYVQDKDDER